MEAKLKELKLSESVLQENSTKVEELVVKLDSADSMNRKLLTEMAALQTEKTAVETVVAKLTKEGDKLRGLLSQNEINSTSSLLQLRWHYLREFPESCQHWRDFVFSVRAGCLRDADSGEEASFGREQHDQHVEPVCLCAQLPGR